MTNFSTDARFPSFAALKSAHGELIQRRRIEGETAAILEAIATFIDRARATGALIDDEHERGAVQSLLNYWSNLLYRVNREPPESTLDDFDPQLNPDLPNSACPYLGLDAFLEADQDKFFGRRLLVAELIQRLDKQRLLTIVGPSGSGKSSLVRAGLIPALKRGAIPGSAVWRYLPPIVPSSEPLRSFASLFRPEHFAISALAVAGSEASSASTPIVIVVDQFEEIFTLCEDVDTRQRFINNLLTLVDTTDAPHRIILTMRSDFETYIARVPVLQERFEAARIQVTPLSAAELRESIEQPAIAVGLKFEEGVIDSLLQDILGEPAGLPLLQFTLLKLWERREHNRITYTAYCQIGGGRLALARSADALYESLIPEDQVTARRILLRIVRPGEGLEITRSRCRRTALFQGSEDPGRVARVLAKLVDARLVRLTDDEDSDDAQVEVTHEALVRNWPMLVEWLEEEKVAIAARRRLESRAAEWVRLGRSDGGLLDEIELREAEHWLTSAEAFALGYNDSIQALVDISRSRIDAARRKREEDFQYLERLTKELAVGNRIINAQRLAFAAQSVARDAPETALLLAYEAAVRDDNPVTGQALRDVIDRVTWVPTTLRGHAQPLRAVACSPDGRWIATAADDGTARLWDLTGAPIACFSGHAGSVVAVAFSPDSQWIATAADDGTARLWDLTGAPIACFSDHKGPIVGVAFDADGRRVLTASSDGTARLWSVDGDCLAVFDRHNGPINDAAFSPNGKLIVTASDDWYVRLWSASGEHLATFRGHTASVLTVAFSPDSRRVVSSSADGTARLWEVTLRDEIGDTVDENGTTLAMLQGRTGSILTAAFSPDGRRIATTSDDGSVLLWDVDGKLVASLNGHTRPVRKVVFGAGGQRIVTISDGGTARLWDSTGRMEATLSGHVGAVRSAALTPDGRHIITASADGTARLWQASETTLPTLRGHRGAIVSAVFSLDGQRIVTASADGTARLWRDDGTLLACLGENVGPIYSAVFSPDGQRIITASDDRTTRLWNAEGEVLATLKGHTRTVRAAAFSSDGRWIITVSDDRTARLWSIDGKPLAILNGHTGIIRSVAFSQDRAASQIVTGSADRTARLWDSDGKLVTILRGHGGSVNCVAFSPNGKRVVTASDDGTARLWDLAGTMIAILQGHRGPVNSIAFNPNGTLIVTASDDGTARLWDFRKGVVWELSGHTDWVVSAAFSPNGRLIVTASVDRTARLWDVSGKELAILKGHTGMVRSAVFSPNGQRVVTASDDGTARQYLVETRDLLAVAACRVGRGLTAGELARFKVDSTRFDFDKRRCPPQIGGE